MYSVRGNFILGFHGCDQSICDEIISNPDKSLNPSENNYDWLGHGIYFWENNPKRALQFAESLRSNPERSKNPIKKPAVLGAVIQLGYCLDLVDSESLEFLKIGYSMLETTLDKSEFESLKNVAPKGADDLLIRRLDCAVIEAVHKYRKDEKLRSFDSVRAVFFEGKNIYPTAGFKEKNHLQICVRNPNCIKGFFLPRKENSKWLVP